MRCKPDELAVISCTSDGTRAFAGLLVTTVRQAREGEFGVGNTGAFGPLWVVAFAAGHRPRYPRHDEQVPPAMGLWPDAWLRPIRDDGSAFDESMLWPCGMPKELSRG